jgi:regulatory protein
VKINQSSFQAAKNYSFLLLKYRQRSEREITDRLKRKKFPEDIILQTLKYLKEEKFVDDSYFARLWIESRLKRSLGLRTIKTQLLQKGVHQDIITQQIAFIQPGYREEEVIEDLIQRRKKLMKDIPAQKAKQRIYAYLLRRGFTPQKIIDAVKAI